MQFPNVSFFAGPSPCVAAIRTVNVTIHPVPFVLDDLLCPGRDEPAIPYLSIAMISR